MIALLNTAKIDLQIKGKKDIPVKRKECFTLSAKNPVSELITFKKGETAFRIEAKIVKRDYLLLSLGGFDMNGHITAYRSRDTEKEFPIESYQWVIVKTIQLKNNQTLDVTVTFI